MTAGHRAAAPRIAARFDALRAEGRGALIGYVEGFDPDRDASLHLLRAMPGAGADLIEVGIPFSDPMADGPTIQAAARRGLAAGATVGGVLDLVRQFRAGDGATPIVLMGYLNPVLAYGTARFCADAAEAGADGLIVVDLPAEEAALLAGDAEREGLDIIRLVAPTTSAERLPLVLRGCSGFVYYVSIAGITGTNTATEAQLAEAIPRLRAATHLPIAIGFGVRTPAQAAAAVRAADAAVVASAVIETIAAGLDEKGRAREGTMERAVAQVRELARGVREARR